MRFCPWYPLADAAAHVPEGETVLQLRVAEGLVDYPTGKSAMVHYAHVTDARAAATALATRFASAALWCRHVDLEGADPIHVDLVAFHAKLVVEFVRRFGREPSP